MENRLHIIDLQNEYLKLTNQVLPQLAKLEHQNWPVSENHCFQRIVLDNLYGGVWQKHLSKPAYQNMSLKQLSSAINLCHKIAKSTVDLNKLNHNSLNWRKKQQESQLKLNF